MDDVLESSVVGIPDEKWGEKVVAAIVKKAPSGIAVGEIQEYCREHLHNWKCPKEIVFLEELPRNTMEKVLNEEVKSFFKFDKLVRPEPIPKKASSLNKEEAF